MKNLFYEKVRRHYKQKSNADRNPLHKNKECYYKKNWLGKTVEKSDVELWDQYSLVPEEWLDIEDWT